MHPLGLFFNTNLVLTFHDIASKERFKKILQVVGKYYRFITMRDIDDYFYSGKKFNNCCHVTFDDGDKTFYDYAFPVLKELGIPATIFVSPRIVDEKFTYWFQDFYEVLKRVDKDTVIRRICKDFGHDYDKLASFDLLAVAKSLKNNDLIATLNAFKKEHNISPLTNCNLSLDQLREIQDSKLVTIGGHTLNHPILANEDDEGARYEITDGLKKLEELLGEKVEYFAYPNGGPGLDFGEREINILKECGIKLSFTTRSRCFNKKSNPYAIPRGGFAGGQEYETGLFARAKLMLMPFIWDKINQKRNHVANQRRIIKQQGLM